MWCEREAHKWSVFMTKFSHGECSAVPQCMFPKHVLRHWFPWTPGKGGFSCQGGYFRGRQRKGSWVLIHMWDSSKTSVWASFISQNGFNWCLINSFHIVFYFPGVGEALKEFSGLGNTFLLQLYLNPGLELMMFANLIHSCVQKSVRWVGNYLLSLWVQRMGNVSYREPWL